MKINMSIAIECFNIGNKAGKGFLPRPDRDVWTRVAKAAGSDQVDVYTTSDSRVIAVGAADGVWEEWAVDITQDLSVANRRELAYNVSRRIRGVK